MIINYLTLQPKHTSAKLQLFTDKKNDTYPEIVYSDELPELWDQHPELSDVQWLYFSLTHPHNCKGSSYEAEINLDNSKRIAKHIISQQIYLYFKRTAIVTTDKVDNVEIWIRKESKSNTKTTEYDRFSLVPVYANFTSGWELLVSFNGSSLVYNTAIDSLDLRTERFRVVADGEVIKHKDLTPEHKQNICAIYPVINHELSNELGVAELRSRNTDRYTTTRDRILHFINQYILTPDFQALFSTSAELLEVPDDRISYVSKGSNVLRFANGNTGFDPYSGLMNFGPYQPTAKPKVKFFFIAHQSDIPICRKLYDVFTRGFSNFPKLSLFIKQEFNTDPNGSIYFKNTDTAIEEVQENLRNKKLVEGTYYVAIYVSPVSRDDVYDPNHDLYFKLKEVLLNWGITSQVIYKDRPTDDKFKFHLANIATALLGKIGGIPWLLNNDHPNSDLIVGVGAFRSEQVGTRYVGSAFCFGTDGLFRNFDCYRDNDLEHLVADIRKAIGYFIVQNQEQYPQRLIIHYYKTMSEREAKPITDMLNTLGFNIPIYVVTINKTETSDIVMFDPTQLGLMPLSGTILKIRRNQFLLYNNSRYRDNQNCDMLFPVRIRLSKIEQNEVVDLDMGEVKALLNQVYKFSRIYWKSVKQKNLPITIKYPEMVAEIVPHFTSAELPSFGKNNLWFL